MITIKKKKKENRKVIAIMSISVVIMIATIILIIVIVPKKENKVENNVNKTTEQTEEEREEEEKNEIKNMSESNRIKRYIGIFLEDIEESRYQDAYNVLNEEFKLNYFPTIEEFITYAQKYLNSDTLAIKYDNIERLGNNKTGNMYVVLATITDIFQPKLAEDEELEQSYFVIVEHDYSNYELSFSVITDEE